MAGTACIVGIDVASDNGETVVSIIDAHNRIEVARVKSGERVEVDAKEICDILIRYGNTKLGYSTMFNHCVLTPLPGFYMHRTR